MTGRGRGGDALGLAAESKDMARKSTGAGFGDGEKERAPATVTATVREQLARESGRESEQMGRATTL